MMFRAIPVSFPPAARHAAVLLFLTAAALLPVSASAVTGPETDDDEEGTAKTTTLAASANPARNLSALQLWAENDLGWSDKFYSSGLKIAYTTPEVFSDGVPRGIRDLITLTPLAQNSALTPTSYRLHFALNYEFYTPKDEYAAEPRPGDHPYAGMLYGTVGISSETDSRLDAIEASVGIVGPSARARQSQNGWHRVIGADLVNGWHTQVRDEPLLQLAWTRVGRYDWGNFGGVRVDWLPRVHLEAGTVRDYATLGAQWRIGWNLPRDFGIGHARSSNALTRPADGLARTLPSHLLPDSVWLFVDAQAEAWLWNTALDGNIWHKSAKVHSDAFVGEVSVGIATQWGGVRLSIAEIFRTREFRGLDHAIFDYTTVSLSVSF
jgi:hypothetical protein